MPGRHRKGDKHAEAMRAVTRVEKPKKKEIPQGKKATPSDLDGAQTLSDRVRRS